MAKKSAIPDDNREYPEYDYRPFPKFVGNDKNGEALIANSEAEIEKLLERKIYPMALGTDRDGNTVYANHPSEVALRQSDVVKSTDEPDKNALTKTQKSDKK